MLYDGAFPRVQGLLNWRCGGCADLLEEAFQETWMIVSRRLTTFEPTRCRFATWVCGIAINVARQLIRKRANERSRMQSLNGNEPAMSEGAKDQSERVAIALDQLPDHYVQVLEAKYFEQFSMEEIAIQRSMTCKAVESLLTRARQAFREAYEKTQ